MTAEAERTKREVRKKDHGPRHGPPVKGLPLGRLVGSRTSNWHCRHLPYLLNRLANLSRAEKPEGSLLAFARDGVAHAQSLSNLLPAGLRLLPPPLPAGLSAPLTSCFPEGNPTGLPCFVCVPEWGRSALFADSFLVTTGVCLAPRPYCVPFGPSLSVPLACW